MIFFGSGLKGATMKLIRFMFLILATSAYFAVTTGPTKAQSANKTTCFSTNSDNYKLEEFYSRGLAACDQEISSGNYSGKKLAPVLRTKAYWLRKMNRLDDALLIYDRAIELDPSNAEGYDYRGGTWLQKGDNDRALTDYSMAIRVEPAYASAYYLRGTIYQAIGKLDLAKSDYLAAIALPAKTAEHDERLGVWAKQQAQAKLNELAKDGTDKK
jgi:tetratricopeptide (TPR) repeat protein